MVLRFILARRGQAAFMVSTSEELELASSPATQMKGRPSTMSLVMPSRFSRWGMSSAAFAQPEMNPIAHASSQQGKVVCFMVEAFPHKEVMQIIY